MSVLNKASTDVRTPQLNTGAAQYGGGGQNGFLHSPFQWTNAAPYVRQPLRAVLVNAPLLMQFMNDAQLQLDTLKTLIELRAQKIDGLQSSVTWDYDGPVITNAGEKMEAVIKASRAVSTPTFEWTVSYGMAEIRYWHDYGRYIIMDPDLQFPGIVALQRYIDAGSPPVLPEAQSMTVLFFEPDQTMTNITNAWLCTNMQPRSAGDIVGRMERGGSSEITTLSIEFTALTMTGEGVYRLAKAYLDTLKLQDLRPLDLKPFYPGINPDVEHAGSTLAAQVTESVIPLGA